MSSQEGVDECACAALSLRSGDINYIQFLERILLNFSSVHDPKTFHKARQYHMT